MSLCKTTVLRLYNEVIEDVISGVREVFLEDGVDEQVLQELKHSWQSKLMASRAVRRIEAENSAHTLRKELNLPTGCNVMPKPQQQQIPKQVVGPNNHVQIIHEEHKLVPIQITLPAQPGSDSGQRVLTIQVPASSIQGNQLHKVLTGPVITATMSLPQALACSVLQQHVNAAFNSQQQSVTIGSTVTKSVIQTDGVLDCDGETNPVGSICINLAGSSSDTNKVIVLSQTDGARDSSDDDEDDVFTETEEEDDDEDMQVAGLTEQPSNTQADMMGQDSTVNKEACLDDQENSTPNPSQQQTVKHVVDQNKNVQVIRDEKLVPIQITLPAQPGDSDERILTIKVPAFSIQDNRLVKVLTASAINATMNLPQEVACSVLQQQINSEFHIEEPTLDLSVNKSVIQTDSGNEDDLVGSSKDTDKVFVLSQIDGAKDTSDEDDQGSDDDDASDEVDDDKDDDEQEMEDAGPEEEPLNSEDDVTDEDPTDVFDTDNVIVCQYDKITRSRNKWKFHLKDGIMHLGGVDYVFQKANGDAEW